MQSVLNLHLAFGLLAIIAALALVWRLPGRRITLYLLTFQILLGLLLLLRFYRGPLTHILPHVLAAVIAWGLYMAANALTRRKADARVILGLTIAATVLVVIAGALGGAMIAHSAGPPRI